MKFHSNYMLIFKNNELIKHIVEEIDKDDKFSKIIENVYIVNENTVDSHHILAEVYKYYNKIKAICNDESFIMIRLTDINII